MDGVLFASIEQPLGYRFQMDKLRDSLAKAFEPLAALLRAHPPEDEEPGGKRKIYISGPMRGHKFFNFDEFLYAETLLEDEWDVVNPARNDMDKGFDPFAFPADFDWSETKNIDASMFAKHDLELLSDCDAIYMLQGWEDSVGAKAEYWVAQWLNLETFYHPEKAPHCEGCEACEDCSVVSKPEGKPSAVLLDDMSMLFFDAIGNVFDHVCAESTSQQDSGRKKLYVCGHGRHGKDTVCEILAEQFDVTFVNSSFFMCERLIYPQMSTQYGIEFESPQECFEQRSQYRRYWYDIIAAYNDEDPSKLSREIFAENDIYCGIRNIAELNASRQLSDLVIWVDASGRLPPESGQSMTILKSDCDIVIENNRTLIELRDRVIRLGNAIGLPAKK